MRYFVRKNIYTFVVVTLIAMAFMQTAANASTTEEIFIQRMGNDAISFLDNSRLSEDQKREEFRKLLNRNFDMETIARFALGRNWNTASVSQRKEYLKLFENMIVRVYAARFSDYNGEDFKVSASRDIGKSDKLITSYIVPPSGSKVQVDWRVRNSNGSLKVIDVIIEGVSMSLTQRSDFSSVIQRGGGNVQILINHLK